MWGSYAPVHHDFDIADNGDVYSLTVEDITDEVKPFGVLSISDNPIVIFNATGSTKSTISLYDILKKTLERQISSFLQDDLNRNAVGKTLDVLHMNTVKIIRSDNGIWGRGDNTKEIVWEYSGKSTQRFFTRGGGRAVRLGNDNILIVERDKGRVFEVTRGGEIVWDYLVPREPDTRRPIISLMQRVNTSTAEKITGRPLGSYS
jgi:hypothetical protein